MKIESSAIQMASSWEHDEMDASTNERTTFRTREAKLSSADADLIDKNPLRILTDRVSISHTARKLNKFNSEMQIKSESQVTVQGKDEAVTHQQISAVNKIVGGIIQKDVVVDAVKKEVSGVVQSNDANKTNSSASQIRGNSSVSGRSSNLRIEDNWGVSVHKTDIHYEDEKMSFNSSGAVRTEDGREINFNLEMEMNRSFLSESEQETILNVWQEEVNLTDPLVINFSGNAPELSDITFEFDLDSDGDMENISFLKPGSGFLAFDKNGDGKVNNGRELFGPGTGNGFNELSEFDEDGNMWIDENDAIYSKLSVWSKGQNGKDVLISLKDADVGAIYLGNTATSFNLNTENNSIKGQIRSTGVFLHENGKVGSVQQIDLADRSNEKIEEQLLASPFGNRIDDPEINRILKKQEETAAAIEKLRMNVVNQRRIEPVKIARNPLEELQKMLEEEISKFKEQLNFIRGDSGLNSKDKPNKPAFMQTGLNLYSMIKEDVMNNWW